MIEFTRGGGARNSPFIRLKQEFRAFSLPEVLITVVIIAILAAVTIPTLNKSKPDENELMHKKATFIVERVVNELVTDEFLYPENAVMTGLGNLSPVKVNGVFHEGETKFCSLFASRINKAPDTKVVCDKGAKSVTSAEGIDWYLPVGNFANKNFEIIKVDVNGEKGPNCAYNSDTCKRPDQFQYQVRSGTKVPVKEVENFGATGAPGARNQMPAAPNSDARDSRTGQKWWKIDCDIPTGHGQIYGVGENKPNGHYKLVAIPEAGYKGSWFTKNVTVKDSDVTDCSVSFTAWTCAIPGACPDSPSNPTPPKPPTPPTPDPDPDDGKTYCINKVVTGETTKCKIGGTNPKECSKSPGKYTLTSTADTGYKATWKSANPISILDKDVTATLECMKEEEDKCYNITASITGLCAVSGTGCKKPGTYNLTITPKDGYSYNNSTSASNRQVILGTSDVNVSVTCTAPPPKEDDACCETAYGSGAKYIQKSNACVKDLGIPNAETVDCKTQKQYCLGILKSWGYPSTYASAYKACRDIGMDIPSKAALLALYNNRQSVFAPCNWGTSASGGTDSGYYTNEDDGIYHGYLPEHIMVHIPYDNLKHVLATRNYGGRIMCSASAPAICSTNPGPDPGGDTVAVNARITSVQNDNKASSLNYMVNWTVTNSPMSAGRKYLVRGMNWITGDTFFTYYGVTTTSNGSYNGAIISIPHYLKSNQVMISVQLQ